MSEQTVYYANLAQALGKGVSGSDALRSTTLCVIETDEGGVYIGTVTTFDVTDDGERNALAYEVASQLVPADAEPEAETHEAEGLADHPDTVTEADLIANPPGEPIAPPEADVATAPDGTTETDAELTADTGNAQGGADTVTGSAALADDPNTAALVDTSPAPAATDADTTAAPDPASAPKGK